MHVFVASKVFHFGRLFTLPLSSSYRAPREPSVVKSMPFPLLRLRPSLPALPKYRASLVRIGQECREEIVESLQVMPWY
jgi:hypothetical protein